MPHESLYPPSDAIVNTFKALGDPVRFAIVSDLLEKPSGRALVKELVAKVIANVGISAPAISRHLQVLENAELVSLTGSTHRRLCRLQRTRFKELFNWAEVEKAHFPSAEESDGNCRLIEYFMNRPDNQIEQNEQLLDGDAPDTYDEQNEQEQSKEDERDQDE